MTALPPTPVESGKPTRPVGAEPYSTTGDTFMWTYRPIGWTSGRPAHVFPMSTVRDDERGLVAWLSPGTLRIEPRSPDGTGPRDLPLPERMAASRYDRCVAARVPWRGPGILRIAPTGCPWSVWLFWTPWKDGTLTFAGWYVNLESPAVREGQDLIASDHVLDLWIEPDGSVTWKDEDELAAAVDQGRYTQAQADAIRRNGGAALAAFRTGAWAFDTAWTQWRQPQAWTTPHLPAETAWALDLTAE